MFNTGLYNYWIETCAVKRQEICMFNAKRGEICHQCLSSVIMSKKEPSS